MKHVHPQLNLHTIHTSNQNFMSCQYFPTERSARAQLMYGPIRDPMASPRALRRPVGTRRTPGGTVGPRLIGASPVWAARSSYWRQPWLLYTFKVPSLS